MVIEFLEQRNSVMTTADGKKKGTYVDISIGNGLLLMAHCEENKEPFTMATEFLVPSNELAASFMVMWRRWCDKHGVSSNNSLLSLINRIISIVKLPCPVYSKREWHILEFRNWLRRS